MSDGSEHGRVVAALAEYVRCLDRGAAATVRAEDRPQYRDRLAQAARMFAALMGVEPDWDKLVAIVDEEERGIGWSYLPGSSGAESETAFSTLRSLVRRDPGRNAKRKG
jgi:hypothetical protein